MPELPEVEVLVRHLQPLLRGRIVEAVTVRRAKTIAPHSAEQFAGTLVGATFHNVRRRGKYLLFELAGKGSPEPLLLAGHLGMTGRMYLVSEWSPLPRHCPVSFKLSGSRRCGTAAAVFVFEDTRYFGRMTLRAESVGRLGPEPLGPKWTAAQLRGALARSGQQVKVRLLDQGTVAGVGNIYASEALFLARISPRKKARSLSPAEVGRLWRAIRKVLSEAIAFGSTVPLNMEGAGEGDGLFYYGRSPGAGGSYEERLRVYDRAGQPCFACGVAVQRIVQGGRSTFYCPHCQPP